MAVEPGQSFGDYEVLGQLGTGGMGRVYKVRNVISNREEAMKVLLPDFAGDPELASRFMAEIRTLATLEHPGIAQLRTAFQYQNQFVMVMELVEGITLEKLAAQIRIPLDHALDYASQVLAALSYAHSRGVTHRDIKPANIMITTHGLIKLMDFGIAKSKEDMQLTRPGTTMGSVYYMSPEQVRGGTADARSDLYSLGVTLYEIFTGRRPFQADTSYTVLDAQLNKPPVPPKDVNPDLPEALNAIVLKAMEKAPEDRFQTADEFRNALKSILDAAAVEQNRAPEVMAPSMPPPPFVPLPMASTAQPAAAPAFVPVPMSPGPPPALPRSHRGLWIALGAGLALLALVAVSLLLPRIFATHASQQNRPPENPPVEAQNAAATAPSKDAGSAPADSSASAETPVLSSQPAKLAGSEATGASSANTGATTKTGKVRPAYAPSQRTQIDSSSVQSAAIQGSQPAAPSGPSAQDLREARDRYSKLEARADAALSNLQQLRAQQQAQGLDLRGDIVAGMSRMQSDLREAQQYLNQNDLSTAGDYMDRADREIATLEKFLGR